MRPRLGANSPVMVRKRRRLPRPVGAYEGHDFAFLNVHRDASERLDGAVIH